MNLNDHPNFVIYLAGCVVAFLLFLLHTVAASILSWISKDNVLKKNVNKIKDPNGVGLAVKASLYVLLALFNAAFSWLGVLFLAGGIIWLPFAYLREALSSVPEEIKLLRFPLRNNPNLSREAVWAYLYALGVKSGATPDPRSINDELYGIGVFHPSFNRQLALETLSSLKVVDPEVVSQVKHWEEEGKPPSDGTLI